MPLGTLDRTPPPFFRQGLSALAKLGLFSTLALLLMVADARWRIVDPLRATLATALLPVQRTLAVPVEAWEGGGDYLQGLREARRAEATARAALVVQSEKALRVDQLAAENAQLRALLELRPTLSVKSTAAEILYEAADPYSRKVFIDRGATQGVARGSPVVNEAGVLGQVTRVYPLTAEVTLLTDRDAAIPVINNRTQQRSAAFGGAGGRQPRDGAALHGRQCRCAGGRRPEHQRPGRRVPAGPARGPGPGCRASGGLRLRAHHPGARSLARRCAPRAGPGAHGAADAPAARAHARARQHLQQSTDGCRRNGARGVPMIMPRGSDQLLLPVNPLFIALSLALALGFNLLPVGRHAAAPDVLAVVLVFWNVHQPRRVSVGLAFFFGLLMDVHEAALLGQHALAYTLLSFAAVTVHRRLLWFGLAEQMLQVLPLFVLATLVSLGVRMAVGGMFPGWWLIFSPLLNALLWPLATWCLLAPQRRAPDPDKHRPL